MLILTSDGRAGLENGGYLGVHFDAHVGLSDDLIVSFLDLGINPVVEWLVNHHVDDYVG